MGFFALVTIGFLFAMSAGGSKGSAEPTQLPPPHPSGTNDGGGGDPADPAIGDDGYPQIVFHEDGSWDEPTEDWFDYASDQMLPMLDPPGSSAPDMEFGDFDYSYILSWEFLKEEMPSDIPYPAEPYAPDGTMWQTSYPGENRFDGPEAVLGLIEHFAAYIEEALPHYNETGELILYPESL